jgi:hypothetical protein
MRLFAPGGVVVACHMAASARHLPTDEGGGDDENHGDQDATFHSLTSLTLAPAPFSFAPVEPSEIIL